MKKSLMISSGILAILALAALGCSNSSAVDSLGEDVSLQSKTSSVKRYIIEGSHLEAIKGEVAVRGGGLIRSMHVISGLVVQLPPEAVKGLKNKFTDISIVEDVQISLIKPLKKPSGSPGNGGGGDSVTPPQQEIPWGILRVQANQAQAAAQGQGVKVCIVDTGIDKSHPDLAGNIVGGKNFVWVKGRVNPNDWNDDNGHGSHVAGTVAALDNSEGVLGVAPKASLYGVKVLDKRGSGYLSDVADGIHECTAAGAQVINMSLGAAGDPNADSPMKTAILEAHNAGVVVVTAAGNSGADIANTVPSGYAETIAVSATDINDQISSWSNYGLTLSDFAAPGVNIKSTWKNGEYNTISGTSMAAPHVAGAIALEMSSELISVGTEDIGYSVIYQGSGLAVLK